MLFDSIVYGPIRSRRLGVSLGINLMPTNAKLCSFDCVYCECGWNQPVAFPVLPSREQVREALSAQMQCLETQPDVLTFSGNGEPTMHPDFLGIIQDTCELRDAFCPHAKVSVLSNSTQLGRAEVIEALRLCDNRILKLDSAIDATMRLIDQPVNKQLTVARIVEWLRAFDGDFTLQTCFLKGEYKGEVIDNTTSRGRTLRFLTDYEGDDFVQHLYAMGTTPLPKYIVRPMSEQTYEEYEKVFSDLLVEEMDEERYQTVFAKHIGAVAAPAAGLFAYPQQIPAPGSTKRYCTVPAASRSIVSSFSLLSFFLCHRVITSSLFG